MTTAAAATASAPITISRASNYAAEIKKMLSGFGRHLFLFKKIRFLGEEESKLSEDLPCKGDFSGTGLVCISGASHGLYPLRDNFKVGVYNFSLEEKGK